jgi:hypothetical protein
MLEASWREATTDSWSHLNLHRRLKFKQLTKWRFSKCFDGDQAKIKILRRAAELMLEEERRRAAQEVPPIFEPYVA